MFRTGGLALLLALLTAAPALAAPQAERVRDINPGPGNSDPMSFARLGDRLYFTAYENVAGAELWTTDGTSAGTRLAAEIEPGPGDGNPAETTPFAGRLFFRAFDTAHGNELWSSDGTQDGTTLVENIDAGTEHSGPGEFTAVGSTLFFVADTVDTGRELWKTTGMGAEPLGDLYPGTGESLPSDLTPFNGKIVFAANNPTYGLEPWISNGTPGGTNYLSNIAPGATSSDPSGFTELDGKLYFSATDFLTGPELWSTAGSFDDATLVKDINTSGGSYPSGFVRLGAKLYFSAYDTVNGTELWATDGTGDGTEIVSNIAPGTQGSFPTGLTELGGKLYFQAYAPGTGLELWVTDGTAAGTQLVKDLAPGAADSYPGGPGSEQEFARLGDKLYFEAQNEDGWELWATDGTAAGTQQVRDIQPGIDGSSPNQFTELAGRLYFSAWTEAEGNELWAVSDPTTIGDPPGVDPPAKAPKVSRLRMTNKRFATRKPKNGAKPRHKVGTTFRFDSSAAGNATLVIERKLRGYRSGKRCVAKRPQGKPNAKRCRLFKRKRTVRAQAKQGANAIAFKGKGLAPGPYRATLTASAAGLKSKPVRIAFKIVAP